MSWVITGITILGILWLTHFVIVIFRNAPSPKSLEAKPEPKAPLQPPTVNREIDL